MQVAVSMYLGGIVIQARQITSYESFKNLGLKCPLCNEAVFYRAGTIPRRFGKSIIKSADACFSHYFAESECELKTKCGASPQFLHKVQIQGKNQRLKLYNLHLWEMFEQLNGLSHKDINYVKKQIGRKRVDEFIENLACDWVHIAEDLKSSGQSILDGCSNASTYKNFTQPLGRGLERIAEYFASDSYKPDIHLAISNEVIDYLATISGRSVIRKILTYIVIVRWYIDEKRSVPSNIAADAVYAVAANIIYSNPWLFLIEERLGK